MLSEVVKSVTSGYLRWMDDGQEDALDGILAAVSEPSSQDVLRTTNWKGDIARETDDLIANKF